MYVYKIIKVLYLDIYELNKTKKNRIINQSVIKFFFPKRLLFTALYQVKKREMKILILLCFVLLVQMWNFVVSEKTTEYSAIKYNIYVIDNMMYNIPSTLNITVRNENTILITIKGCGPIFKENVDRFSEFDVMFWETEIRKYVIDDMEIILTRQFTIYPQYVKDFVKRQLELIYPQLTWYLPDGLNLNVLKTSVDLYF